MKKAPLVVVSMGIGAACALLIPEQFVLIPVVGCFVVCIALAWLVAFQNNAVQLTPFRLFFWPWLDITASVQDSTAFRILCACGCLAAGACIGLLIRVIAG